MATAMSTQTRGFFKQLAHQCSCCCSLWPRSLAESRCKRNILLCCCTTVHNHH